MICIKMLSIGYQITFKIKRNRIRMEKLEKTETLGLGDRKKKMKNHFQSCATQAENSQCMVLLIEIFVKFIDSTFNRNSIFSELSVNIEQILHKNYFNSGIKIEKEGFKNIFCLNC